MVMPLHLTIVICILAIIRQAEFTKTIENYRNDSHLPKLVKLTTKQGLIMNQVLAIYALDKTENPPCKKHTKKFKDALRAFEPWALKMFDSSSKLQAGLLAGNLAELGSFQQCISIKTGDISGKHCLIKITPSINLIRKVLQFRNINAQSFDKLEIIVKSAAVYWSVCVPKSCPEEEIFQHFNRNIVEIADGLELRVDLEGKNCVTLEDSPKLQLPQYLAIAFLGSFVATAIICTTIELYGHKGAVINAFSIIANYKRITNSQGSGDLEFVHGLRFLSTAYVVIGHRYLLAMFYPLVNYLDILNWTLNYTSTIIIGGTICVDTFFFISGMLVSIGFFKHVTASGQFNPVAFYLHRYLRITPALAIVVLIYSTLVQFFGSGPLWRSTYEALQGPCQLFWWSSLLHVQSYTNPDALCILQTWYLTCDTLYYYCAPLVLYPLWKWRIVGYINYIAVYISSIGINFYLAWRNQYEGVMPITNQLLETEYFQRHYQVPHTRAAPYILGLGFGLALFKRKDRVKINPIFRVAGWSVAIVAMALSVVGCHSFLVERHVYNRVEAAMFLSCSRSAWTVGLMWMAYACANNYGGFVNYFLSGFVFKVLGRISYGIFLLHMLLLFLTNGAGKTPNYFSNFTMIYDSLADLCLMMVVGFLFTLFYELPILKMVELLWGKKKIVPIEK